LNVGNDLNLDFGRSVTCGRGRDLFLFDTKETAQKLRKWVPPCDRSLSLCFGRTAEDG
jgi:hypothetical protein